MCGNLTRGVSNFSPSYNQFNYPSMEFRGRMEYSHSPSLLEGSNKKRTKCGKNEWHTIAKWQQNIKHIWLISQSSQRAGVAWVQYRWATQAPEMVVHDPNFAQGIQHTCVAASTCKRPEWELERIISRFSFTSSKYSTSNSQFILSTSNMDSFLRN